MVSGSPAASPDSSDNSDTQHSGGSDMEMDDQMMTGSKRSQQRLSDTEVLAHSVRLLWIGDFLLFYGFMEWM